MCTYVQGCMVHLFTVNTEEDEESKKERETVHKSVEHISNARTNTSITARMKKTNRPNVLSSDIQ